MDNFQPHFSYVASLPENALTTKNEQLCMLSSSEICEWLSKEPVRLRRKSAEVYSECSKWWFLALTHARSWVRYWSWLCRSHFA